MGAAVWLRSAGVSDAPALARLHRAPAPPPCQGSTPPGIARNAGARCFHEAHGFRVAATSDGADTEEGGPDILFSGMARFR